MLIYRGRNGISCWTRLTANGCTADSVSASLTRKVHFTFKADFRARAALISGEGDLLSYPNSNIGAEEDTSSTKQIGKPTGIEIQPDAAAFGTIAAEITPTTSSFSGNDEYDLDCPTEGFSSIAEAIEDIHQGKVSACIC